MSYLAYRQPAWWPSTVPAFLLAVLAAGCGSDEQIQSYNVAKEVEPAATPVAAQPVEIGEPTHRMLAAIVPVGEQAYFFKVVGPLEEMNKHASDIEKFFSSIRVGPENAIPDWKPAARWTAEPGTGMRVATIKIPAEAEPLDMSVIALPWRGTPGELLSNINRWRGQMKLPEVQQNELGQFTKETKAGDTTITVVDLEGRFDAGSAMMPPFAGGAAGRPVGDSATPQLPPGHPPIDAVEALPAETAPRAMEFEAPDTWQPLPAGGMRKAAFQIGDEQTGALVTVIDFPTDAGVMIADPLENVNRWRREVGMPPLTKEQLDETVEERKVSGHSARYVKLVPDAAKPEESQNDRATIAALVNSGSRIWFFKMTGHRDTVTAQQEAFDKFLESVRILANGGEPHGNR